MKVICISGQARHGKDTVAEMMRHHLWGEGERVLIAHYADLLKYICKQFFHWNGEKDDAGRTLLQQVGTDVIRAQEPDYWVSFIAHILYLFRDTWGFVLIPDCRFPNEIEYLREKGFDVTHVRVVRDGFDNGLTDEQRAHPSETALDGTTPDVTIHNDGSIIDLAKEVLKVIVPIWRQEEAKRIEQDKLHHD